MARIVDYSTLVQAVKDTAEDDGTEFAEFITTALGLAEDRLFLELDLPELEEDSTGTLTASTETLSKPSGYKYAESFIVTTSTERIMLRKKKISYLRDYWPDVSETGTPKYYGDKSNTTFLIAPTPDDNYAYEIRFTQKPVKLSTTNTANYFLTNCTDILFYAIMSEMAKFMKAWSQVQFWENKFSVRQQAWTIQAKKYREDSGTFRMKDLYVPDQDPTDRSQ